MLFHCFTNLYQTLIKVSGTIPCQLFSPDCLTRQLLDQTISKNKASGAERLDILSMSTSDGLWTRPALQSGKPDIWPRGLELKMSLIPAAFTLQHAQATVVFINSLWEGKISVRCATRGWQKSATDLPSQTWSWVVLFQFCPRANLLYKGSAANGHLTPGSRKRVSQSRSLILLLGPLMIEKARETIIILYSNYLHDRRHCISPNSHLASALQN